MSTNFFTPLRYPGGKSRLGPWIANLMRYNGISGGEYVEPYGGGSGVALYLIINGYVRNIVINDLDSLIHSFWYSVLKDTDNFLDLIDKTPITMEVWFRQREIAQDIKCRNKLKKGFAAFFLNRTNRSGILKGGVIGGKEQKGKYKINARYNKKDLMRRIQKIAKFKNNIEILNLDAIDLLKLHKSRKNEKSLIYLDPPYYNKGSQLYRNYYSPEDHKKISETINSVPLPWLVTYDDCIEINKLYKTNKSVKFSLVYSTNKERPTSTELMVYGNIKLTRPPELIRSTKPYPKKWDTLAVA